MISNKQYLSAAAGILAVEAYHAGIARLIIFMEGEQPVTVNPNPPTNTNVFGVATVSLNIQLACRGCTDWIDCKELQLCSAQAPQPC